jgi:LPXTG-site transpeptidase (sortase) family protein
MINDREPKISEIESLIDHFKKTDREHELLEILRRHNIKGPDEIMDVIEDNTHEFHNESIVINKLAWSEGFKKRTMHPFKWFAWHFKNKWYVKFGTYWVLAFMFLFALLNAPIFVTRFSIPNKSEGPKIVTTQEMVGGASAESAPLAEGEIIPSGTHLKVPKINVNAPIVFSPTPDEETIQQYLQRGIVHYPSTAKPGEVGNTFLTGHSSNFWWMKGNFNYVFVNLDKLTTGDQAIIYHSGNKYVYTVTEKKVVTPDETSVLAQTDTPTLTLMTCTPPGTNWKRLIITLEQTAPKYVKPRLVTKQVIIDEPKRLVSTDSNSMGGWIRSIWEQITNTK